MIKEWVGQWKISFISDPSRQAQEVIFSRKTKKSDHHPLVFNPLMHNVPKWPNTLKNLATFTA